jgi:hypothetical protein
MSANVDAMVREGIRAYRAGNKTEARTLLMKATELDEYNEQAWLWLSAVVETPEEQRTCLENVLIINPSNERAKNGIQMLTAKTSGAPKTAPPVSSSPPAATNPFGAAPAEDEMPTSLEWDMPAIETSSPSSTFRPNEPTKQDYDDWVSSLNLGGSGASPAPSASVDAFSMTPFTDQESLFGEEEDEPALPPSAPTQSRPAVPAAPPPPKTSPPTSMPRSAPLMSPAAEDDDDLLDDIEDTNLDDFDDVFDDVDDDRDPSEYFRLIPSEIKATRLPGEDEKYPAFIPIGIALLVILNLAAAGLLVVNLLG